MKAYVEWDEGYINEDGKVGGWLIWEILEEDGIELDRFVVELNDALRAENMNLQAARVASDYGDLRISVYREPTDAERKAFAKREAENAERQAEYDFTLLARIRNDHPEWFSQDSNNPFNAESNDGAD